MSAISQAKIDKMTSWIRSDNNSSLWAKNTPPKNPPLKSDLTVDVAVVGAGYTGLSSAYHIKKLLPEKTVVVLEAKSAGNGASGRNGGMCLTQPSIEYMSIVHPESHKLTYDTTAQSIKDLGHLMRERGYGSDIAFRGSLMTNFSERGAKRSKGYAAKAAAMGIPIEYWDKKRVSQEIGTGVYAGGLFDPSAAEADPMKIVRALKESAERLGVFVYEDSPVVDISEGKTVRLLVMGEDGNLYRVAAGAIVLGTDAYTSRLGYFHDRVLVFHTELAATKPLGNEVFSRIGWTSRIPFHDDHVFLYHLGTTHDGRITIGAGNAEYFFNESLTYRKDLGKRGDALKEELVRIFPPLREVEFEYVWSGALSLSFDMSQSVGVTGKNGNIYYGLSYVGHGVTLAFLFGKIIADIYAGKGKEWKAMPFYQNSLPRILPPEPLRYVVIKSYMGYLRFKDKIGWR